MWKRIQQNYGRTPFFSECGPFVKDWILSRYSSLADQNIKFIDQVCTRFGWQIDFRLSCECACLGTKSHRVLELLRSVSADTYYCAQGSFMYMWEEGVFPIDDIEILFQDFVPKLYPQALSEDFVPYLSVLDALFNIGPEATRDLIEHGTEKWLEWNQLYQRCVHE